MMSLARFLPYERKSNEKYLGWEYRSKEWEG
jgi:hypothetical protein